MESARTIVCGIAIALGGCVLRDPGHDFRPTGLVQAEQLCPAQPAGSPCPPCSVPERELCADQYYGGVYRCADEAGCPGGSCREGFCLFRDDDRDGLDDRLEREIAERNLPRLALHVDEKCGAPSALLYRVRRHPAALRRLAVTYVALYSRDCGAFNGHIGDNEAFAITVDPDAAPGPAATVGLITQAHRGTLCDSMSTCETEAGTGACASTVGGQTSVVVWVSRDKHGNYVDRETCSQNCLDACGAASFAGDIPLEAAGQPTAPLTHDLTADGLVTAAGGWEPALLHYDAWGDAPFGGASRPRDQLITLVAPVGR
jgi:hypothetical protein